MQISLRPVESILPYARNPRHNQQAVAKVAASIKAFGFKQPILVDTESTIVTGHTRWLAAQRLGLREVPVMVADDLTPTEIQAYRLMDNRSHEEATWDTDLLIPELQDLKAKDWDLALTGFNPEEIARLTALTHALAEGSAEALPGPPKAPQSKLGELWALGRHRLLCGDACSPEAVQRLMGGTLADLGFSDPPYNVNYEGYTADQLKLQGDSHASEADFEAFLTPIFVSYQQSLKKTASLYVCHSTLYQRAFQNALEKSGFCIRTVLIWAKHHFGWGHGRYKYQHEPIFYCHRQGEVDAWYGDKSASTLWQFDKPSANRLHPTMKPVGLIEKALINSSQAGDTVVDLLAGSGTTLLACEQTGRSAYVMEIDPRYCDVIRERWENWSGEPAQLIA
jgi:DNA modification methylase